MTYGPETDTHHDRAGDVKPQLGAVHQSGLEEPIEGSLKPLFRESESVQ